jgi:hypothetical protein
MDVIHLLHKLLFAEDGQHILLRLPKRILVTFLLMFKLRQREKNSRAFR